MYSDNSNHHRRSIRIPKYDYSQAGIYFITICTRNHECIFGDIIDGEIILNDFGRIVDTYWQWLDQHFSYVELDKYIIMPNHLHSIIIFNNDYYDVYRRGGSRTAPTTIKRKPLGRLIGAFKTVSTKHINRIHRTKGSIIWQRNYYEHVIRNENDLNQIRKYIIENPIRWEMDEENPTNMFDD